MIRNEAAKRRVGEAVIEAFGLKGVDPLALYQRLRRIECRAHRNAEAYCNGDVTEEEYDARQDKVLGDLDRLLDFRSKGYPIILNNDPRGYALKIPADWVQEHRLRIHTDWGGYGIIAPDLN